MIELYYKTNIILGFKYLVFFILLRAVNGDGKHNAAFVGKGMDGGRGCASRLTAIKPTTLFNMSEQLQQVADLITANTIFTTKEVLTSEEAAKYLGISKSYLYKLTMNRAIPCYKPMGKLCYFNRHELEAWLQTNRIATSEEIEQQAQDYCAKKGGKA